MPVRQAAEEAAKHLQIKHSEDIVVRNSTLVFQFFLNHAQISTEQLPPGSPGIRELENPKHTQVHQAAQASPSRGLRRRSVSAVRQRPPEPSENARSVTPSKLNGASTCSPMSRARPQTYRALEEAGLPVPLIKVYSDRELTAHMVQYVEPESLSATLLILVTGGYCDRYATHRRLEGTNICARKDPGACCWRSCEFP
jgi:hypothetical protein